MIIACDVIRKSKSNEKSQGEIILSLKFGPRVLLFHTYFKPGKNG